MPITDMNDEANIDLQLDDLPSNGSESSSGSTFDPSLVDLLKRDVEEASKIEDVLIPVAGYSYSNLSIKYRMPEEGGKELDFIARKVFRETRDDYDRNVRIAIDTIVTLCEGLYVQPEDVPEPVAFDPDNEGTPVRFDQRLAKVFGMEDNTGARALVRRLFAGNDLVIITHAEKLSRWIMDKKADLESEVWQLGGR